MLFVVMRSISYCDFNTLPEGKIHRNLKFANSVTANRPELNSTSNKMIFREWP